MGIAVAMKRPGARKKAFNAGVENHWKSAHYLALDLETTGLDLRRDEIISIGCVEIEAGTILGATKTYTEIKPNQSPSISAMQVHGIRAVDLQGAQSIKEVAPELKRRLHNKVLVAHAAWIERAFLSPQLGRSFPSHVIDTAALARACGYSDSTSHEPSLEYLARQLNLPVYSPHHALGDAMTTAVVFLSLATELERKQVLEGGLDLTFDQLFKISEKYRTRH